MNLTKKIFFLFFLIPLSANAEDGKAIIEKMINKMRGHSNISEYVMTVKRPAWTRSVKMKVWDDRARQRVFVRILEPAKDQGVSFLRIGYNLWNYLPSVEKVMKLPPSMMLQPWMGSDFTNDDLVKESSYIDDYDHVIVGEEGGEEGPILTKIELIPHPNAPVVWGKVIFWVQKGDNFPGKDLPVMQHFLDEKGKLIKVLDYKALQKVDGVLLPTLWEMTPMTQQSQSTTLRLINADFDPSPPISDSVFTEKNLRP